MRRKSFHQATSNLKSSHSQGGETKTMKKQISTILAGALLFASMVPAMAGASDVTLADKYNALNSKGIFTSQNFEKSLTRAELAVILQRLLEQPTATYSASFTDVPNWAKSAVQVGVNKGYFANGKKIQP